MGEYVRLVAAIEQRTGAKVYGRLLDRVAALVDEHDVERLVAWVRDFPGDHAGPPVLVDELEAAVAAGRALPVSGPPDSADGALPSSPPEWLVDRSAELEALSTDLASEFVPAPESLAARLLRIGHNGTSEGSE